jgi:YD repeat-containing protein
MSDIVDVEIIDDYDIVLEILQGVVTISSGDTGAFVSYGQEQQLSLAQYRQARRNLNTGSGPTLTYNIDGRLTSILYSDGSSKTFTYDGAGLLTSVQFTAGPRVYTKTLAYSSGKLVSVTESITGV